jgi:hypothetical protein
MTSLSKPITRQLALYDTAGKPLLLTLAPDNILSFRAKGGRGAVQIDLDTVYRIACGTKTVGYTDDEIRALRGLEAKVMTNPEWSAPDAYKCLVTIREQIKRAQAGAKEEEEEDEEARKEVVQAKGGTKPMRLSRK